MTEKQVEGYIKYNLQMEPRHDCYALAQAITDVSMDMDYDEFELMELYSFVITTLLLNL